MISFLGLSLSLYTHTGMPSLKANEKVNTVYDDILFLNQMTTLMGFLLLHEVNQIVQCLGKKKIFFTAYKNLSDHILVASRFYCDIETLSPGDSSHCF